MANIELTFRRVVAAAKQRADSSALPLSRVRKICQFADQSADPLAMDRSVGAAVSVMAELMVAELCRHGGDEADLLRAVAAADHLDFLSDVLPAARAADAADRLDLGAFRLVDEQGRDVGRLWLQLRCDADDPRSLLADGRVDLLLVRGDSHVRFVAEFQRCSATPRRVVLDGVGGRAEQVRGSFEFNDASRIDLSGRTPVTRFWHAAAEPAPDAAVDELPDRGTALLKLAFTEDAVVDNMAGFMRTEASFDCFPLTTN